jgi:hypothetical protein
MAERKLRLIKRMAEFQPIENVKHVPRKRRGIYVLYRRRMRGGKEYFNVVYVGMARSGMQGRLKTHQRKKDGLWTHFSVYEVWDNIRDEEIEELEGLFRFIYRKDSGANALNVQRNFKKAKSVRQNNLRLWTQ